jgi:hypothetical protein
MVGPVLLQLNRYLLVTLVTHAEDLLVIFTFSCVTLFLAAVIAVTPGIGVIGLFLTVTTSTVTSDHSPSSAADLFAVDVSVIWTSFAHVWHLGYHLSST